MDRYIGIDVHSKSCTVAVMNATGQRLKEQVIETSATVLIDAMRSIAGKRHVCFEEGVLSSWIYELLEPNVDELVVVQPHTRQQGSKSDSIDAWALAENLRTGSIKRRVFKNPRRFDQLRQAVRAYQIAVQDMTRAKNRLNALYRSRAIQVDAAIYDPKQRTEWLRKLPTAHRMLGEMLSQQLDALIEAHRRAEQWLHKEALQLAEVKRLMTVDGLGPIRAAQIVAVVLVPERFRTKRQFWSYCGLAIVTRSSSDYVRNPSTGQWWRQPVIQTRGLNRNRSPILKNAFKAAARTVIAMPTHPLHADYERMLEDGTKPNLATLTIARRIAAAVLAIWKHKEDYTREKHRQTAA